MDALTRESNIKCAAKNGDGIRKMSAADAGSTNNAYHLPAATTPAASIASCIDIQPAAIACGAAESSKHQSSLYFSQEASSIFDKALAISSAPNDDPPVWGDCADLEDLGEVADKHFGGSCSTPTFKSARGKTEEPFEFFLDDDAGAPAYDSMHTNLNGKDESKPAGSSAAGSRIRSGNTADLKSDTPIFEDTMFMGDMAIAQGEMNSTSSALLLFDAKSVFDDDVSTDRLNNTKENSREQRASSTHFSSPTKPKPHQAFTAASLHIITPRSSVDSTLMPVVTPLPILRQVTPPEDPMNIHLAQRSHIDGSTSNSEEIPATEKVRTHKDQQDHCSKGASKTDAAWKRRFLELEVRYYTLFRVL